MEKSLTGLKCD